LRAVSLVGADGITLKAATVTCDQGEKVMFGIPRRFGEDKNREILHRFGPKKKRRFADEKPPSEWKEKGEKRQAARAG